MLWSSGMVRLYANSRSTWRRPNSPTRAGALDTRGGASVRMTRQILYAWRARRFRSRRVRMNSLAESIAAGRTHANRERERVANCADIRLAEAGDVVCRSVRRRRDWNGQAALHGNAALEAHQLHRDLTLVVVHRDDAVVRAAARANEDGIGGKRTVAAPSTPRGELDRRRDHIDLLASEIAAVAVVRIQAAYREARRRLPRALQCAIEEPDALRDAFDRQQRRDIFQRDVRGDARGPEVLEHVELDAGAGPGEHLGEPMHLIGMSHPACAKGTLVERRKAERVGLAGAHEINPRAQSLQHEPSIVRPGNAARKFWGVEC